MLKINKSVHFNILCIVVVVFVCTYLYYTISDVKKIAAEVKKHTQDVNNIISSLATVTKELGDIKKKSATVCTLKENIVTPSVTIKEQFDDDASSVDTIEVKNLLGDIHDDEDEKDENNEFIDEDIDEEIDEEIEAEPEEILPEITFKDMSFEELKKKSYDDIKKYCKDNGLNMKGTKDVLIQRIIKYEPICI